MKKLIALLFCISMAFNALAQQQQQPRPQRRNMPEIYSPRLKQFYQIVDSTSFLNNDRKPLIGVSVTSSMKGTCTRSIELAGGIPVIIPASSDPILMNQTLDLLDGLMMSGGEDIHPEYYGDTIQAACGKIDEKRDYYELMILKKAIDRNIPVIGVCRGMQIINVAMGGSLYQDLPTEKPSEIKHAQYENSLVPAHEVTLLPNTEVSRIFGQQMMGVNSRHHQAVKKLAPGLKITAWSTDSIPEAVEAYPAKSIMAVQWHPEINAAAGDKEALKFFTTFVERAKTFAKAKAIHSRIMSIDTHTDAPMGWSRGYALGDRKSNQVNIPKMIEGHLDAQFLAAFLGQGERDDASLQKAVDKCQTLLNSIHEQVAKYPDYAGIARTEAEARALKAQGKRAFFIGIENGYGIGKDLKNIKRFYDQGANYITLCHSYDNDICHSSTNTEDENLGLTDFGKKVVKEMNRVGMLIDLSHASMGTFWDVIKLSKQPVFCSHSGAKDVFFHNRNLNDDQLRALAKNGGVIQICIFASYMGADRNKTNVEDVVDHIDHCVKVAGIDHVGIGSDFDGGGGVIGCNGDNDMIQITVKLLERGYTEEQLEKIWAGNFFRVLNAVRK
ncbi:MAG: membrane dipeptidase [Bacteroidaceae bacterium]|nr:membrane dipeptidase [Bacteroidaceae bacterium]MCF0187052.1 membrane dipeptidase [Bacteroidaceae bacterium]